MTNKAAYPFFCLLLMLLSTSCFNKRPIMSFSIEEDISSSNIKSDELVRVHLQNGKMVDGFLRSIQKDSLILECCDYQKLLNSVITSRNSLKNGELYTKPQRIGEESGVRISIGVEEVKSFEKLHAKAFNPRHVNWFYPGEEVSVLLYNGLERKGIIYATKLDGIVLSSENGKLYLNWSNIKEIKIIRKTLAQKIMKIVHITLISTVVLYSVLLFIALGSIDFSSF